MRPSERAGSACPRPGVAQLGCVLRGCLSCGASRLFLREPLAECCWSSRSSLSSTSASAVVFLQGPNVSIPRGHQSQGHNGLKGSCSSGLRGMGWRAGRCLLAWQHPQTGLCAAKKEPGTGRSHSGLLNFAFSKVSVFRNDFHSPRFCAEFRNRPKIGLFLGMVGN